MNNRHNPAISWWGSLGETDGNKSAAPDDESRSGPKERVFSLEDAINYALKHNRDILNNYDQSVKSHYSIVSAESQFEVKITPSGNVEINRDGESHSYGVGASKKFSTGTKVSTDADMSKSNPSSHTSNVSVGITQPLLRGAGREVNRNSVISAERALEGQLRSYELAKERLILDVASSFHEVMRQRAIVMLNERSAQRVERLLQISKARQGVGLANKLDVLRAEIQLSEAMDSLESARKSLKDARDELKLLMGLDTGVKIALRSQLAYSLSTITEEEAIETARKNRLDLFEERDRIKDARRLIRVAKNDVLPDLGLTLGYALTGNGDSAGSSTNLSQSAWTVGLSTSTDLRRTAERAQLEQRRIDLKIRQRSYTEKNEKTVQDVRKEVRRLKENQARIEIQRKNMAQSQRKLQLARIRFAKGMGDNFDVIEAEQDLISSESRYIFVVTDYILSQFRVRKAMGTLTEKPGYLK